MNRLSNLNRYGLNTIYDNNNMVAIHFIALRNSAGGIKLKYNNKPCQ